MRRKQSLATRAAAAARTAQSLTLLVVAMMAASLVAGCASTPADKAPFKDVPAERIVKPDVTQPGAGRVAVDLRRERTDNVIVRFRDALVYVDGERVADIMNGEHIVFWLTPGTHRIAVSTQFDPVVEIGFFVTPDTRYSNRASVSFNDDHRIMLRRVAN
ncbi:hypothetical protein GCT13_30695 [Paraburkholderia sp. CNPSo 3157]|uniref:DUF2846 domain-containing protein n=1 Tax=Paraburkholderia franconis TaxID=2654983 RepID=A0A7X1NGK9_9BURK|nr:hypothetical protein [Paraburkholderia franconis]MPW21128.1 hypothetical protein [Paraburkholderia franconis]